MCSPPSNDKVASTDEIPMNVSDKEDDSGRIWDLYHNKCQWLKDHSTILLILVLIGLLVLGHAVMNSDGNATTSSWFSFLRKSHLFRNLIRGSLLKMGGDLMGGLPLEVWKSRVILHHVERRKKQRQHSGSVYDQLETGEPSEDNDSEDYDDDDENPNSFTLLVRIIQERGVGALWSGVAPRMVEGFFSGAILLAAKEGARETLLSFFASTLPIPIIGFISGAFGGAAQALVMTPTQLLVTAAVSGNNDLTDIWNEHGIRGLYRGAPAVAAKQATNWTTRQGFSDFARPFIPWTGIPGEIAAACIGGIISCWNTPFEVARITAQSKSFLKNHTNEHDNNSIIIGNDTTCATTISIDKKATTKQTEELSMLGTMYGIVKDEGIAGLYVGIVPRLFQACYVTIFLVCIPRLLDG